MELQGQVKIPAARAKVWAALHDPAVLREAIPGCTDLQQLGDGEFSVLVEGRLGMVRATFNAILTFSDETPMQRTAVSAAALAGNVGSANGRAAVTLSEENGDTLVIYEADGEVGGKLTQVGTRLIDSTALDVANRFFARFGELVSENPIVRVEHRIGRAAAGAVAAAGHVAEAGVEATVEAGREAEEKVERAAVGGFLGGPMIWGLLALVALTAVLMYLR
jgi:carbon monoxide dehydrogenase subunit G